MVHINSFNLSLDILVSEFIFNIFDKSGIPSLFWPKRVSGKCQLFRRR